MSDSADVIVVGGGIQGLSAGIHLLENGAGSVRLLERDGLCEATTAAGAGFVGLWAMAPPYDRRELDVERYGIEYYRSLDEAGHDLEFGQNGLLFVAADEKALAMIEGTWRKQDHLRSVRKGPAAELDPEPVLIEPARVEELTGGTVRADGIVAGAFQAGAAQVHAPRAGAAMASRFTELGGRIETRRPVSELIVEGEKVRGVKTSPGVVESDTVVLAAGAWSNHLLAPTGLFLASVPLLASRIVTEPLDVAREMPVTFLVGMTPTMPLLWLRSHNGALLWGGVYLGDPREDLVGEPLPDRFDETALGGVADCQQVATEVADYVPALGRYRKMVVKHGAPCYTPDHRALIGPAPGLQGLWVMTGDNEAGVTHGPGFGKVLADHIVHGSSEIADLDAWRIDRFDEDYADDVAVAAAVRASLEDQAAGKDRPLGDS